MFNQSCRNLSCNSIHIFPNHFELCSGTCKPIYICTWTVIYVYDRISFSLYNHTGLCKFRSLGTVYWYMYNVFTHVHESNVRMTVYYQLFHVKLPTPIIEKRNIDISCDIFRLKSEKGNIVDISVISNW